MIAQAVQEAFSPEWSKTPVPNPPHELVLLRHIIPWPSIRARLVPFYKPPKGRTGHALRSLVAVSIVARLRPLRDRKGIAPIQENRYLQYFCNVSDPGRRTFLHPSTLCRFRKRLGPEGIAVIAAQGFQYLKRAAVIEAALRLMDSTVLESPLIYPTDVRLLDKAFDKMAVLARDNQSELWGDPVYGKQRWRAYNLDRKTRRLAYLSEFSAVFQPALERVEAPQGHLPKGPRQVRGHALLAVRQLREAQTQQKLAGQPHIANRLVSLDDLDARPIQKGKSPPRTEFGTTLPLAFNRPGFRITAENFMGKPNDTPRYGPPLERFRQRRQAYPPSAVTDLGFRSAKNLKLQGQDLDQVFMGRSSDVAEDPQETCRQARSATEGFIAVANHLRGFGQSLDRGLQGATIWTRRSQGAYNWHKFLQLYRAEALEESTLIKRRL